MELTGVVIEMNPTTMTAEVLLPEEERVEVMEVSRPYRFGEEINLSDVYSMSFWDRF